MSEHWIDFTPEPPKPPEVIPAGTYIARILSVEEKQSQHSGRSYWHWIMSVENVHPDFRLHYSTLIEDKNKRLAELVKAVTGKKPKSKILINPQDYLNVRVSVEVTRKIIVTKMANEIISIKHIYDNYGT